MYSANSLKLYRLYYRMYRVRYVRMKDEYFNSAEFFHYRRLLEFHIRRCTIFVPINKVIPKKKRWDASKDRASLDDRVDEF